MSREGGPLACPDWTCKELLMRAADMTAATAADGLEPWSLLLTEVGGAIAVVELRSLG